MSISVQQQLTQHTRGLSAGNWVLEHVPFPIDAQIRKRAPHTINQHSRRTQHGTHNSGRIEGVAVVRRPVRPKRALPKADFATQKLPPLTSDGSHTLSLIRPNLYVNVGAALRSSERASTLIDVDVDGRACEQWSYVLSIIYRIC